MKSSERYLSFTLGDQHFAIPLLAVREVIALPEVTKIPYAPAYFCGIMNLRGTVIAVIDLRKKLQINPAAHREETVIISDLGQITMGVVVDSVDLVLNVDKEHVLPKPSMQTAVKSDYITAVYHHKDQLIIFLDLIKSLNVEDLASLQNALKKSA